MSQPEKNHGPAWWVWVRTHVFLMPPGVPLEYSEKRAKKEQAKKSQQGADPGALDPWTQPLAPAPRHSRSTSPASAGTSAGSWAVENEKTFGAALAKVLRVADRKSTRLNSSHVAISYAVFCLKKKTRT